MIGPTSCTFSTFAAAAGDRRLRNSAAPHNPGKCSSSKKDTQHLFCPQNQALVVASQGEQQGDQRFQVGLLLGHPETHFYLNLHAGWPGWPGWPNDLWERWPRGSDAQIELHKAAQRCARIFRKPDFTWTKRAAVARTPG